MQQLTQRTSAQSAQSAPANTAFQFSGKGILYSYTIVQDAPAGFEEQAPYVLAMIALDEGAMVTAQLTDLDPAQPPEIGMRVEMVTRKLRTEGREGVIQYGYKFRRIIGE